MTATNSLKKQFAHLNPLWFDELIQYSSIKTFEQGTQILREGQYIKVIPIVIEGLLKVFTSHNDKELLLYYIKPNESCIMSFASSLKNETSKVFAIVEEKTTALLMPVDKVSEWINQYPDINTLFFQQFNLRYSDLLETIHHVLFGKMDRRLFNYLKEKVRLTDKNPLKISHRQIAAELGTAREVVSRLIKKLENEGKLQQHSSGIEILEL